MKFGLSFVRPLSHPAGLKSLLLSKVNQGTSHTKSLMLSPHALLSALPPTGHTPLCQSSLPKCEEQTVQSSPEQCVRIASDVKLSLQFTVQALVVELISSVDTVVQMCPQSC